MGKDTPENIGNPFAQLKSKKFPDQKVDENQKTGKFNKNTIYKIKNTPVSSNKDTVVDDDNSLFFANMLSVQKLASSSKENKKHKSHKKDQHKNNTQNNDNEQNKNTSSNLNNIQKIDSNHAELKSGYINIESKKLLSQNMNFTTEHKIETALNIKGDTPNTHNPFEMSQTFSQALSSQYKNNITEKKSNFSSKNNIEPDNKSKNTSESTIKNSADIDNDEDDLSLFFTEVSNVKNLHGKGREVTPEPIITPVPSPPVINPLQVFMDEKLEFALHSTEEYVEAHVLGLDLMTVGKLQARQYKPEAHIDLHGLNSEQAYINLVAFFRNSYQRGLRSVLVVTGKGKNSINSIPVLRNNVQEWFIKDPFKRVILAFCSAKIEDGGSGALYVLIRKQRKDYGNIQWEINQNDPDFFL